MSVFTFMGANIMRHDDQYSFHVINRILETVVPALVTVISHLMCPLLLSIRKIMNFSLPELMNFLDESYEPLFQKSSVIEVKLVLEFFFFL